jgi:hypothetical protein
MGGSCEIPHSKFNVLPRLLSVICVLKALPYGFANLAIGKIDQVVRIQEAGARSRFAKSNHKQLCSGGIRKRSRGSL